VRAFNDEINQTSHDRDRRRDGLQREQEDLERRIDTLLDAFASSGLKGASVQTKLEALETRQCELAKELAGLVDDPVRLHLNLAAIYQRKVATLQKLLEDDATRSKAVRSHPLIGRSDDLPPYRRGRTRGRVRRRHRQDGPSGPELQ
jgi:site-specific DNA recombinase